MKVNVNELKTVASICKHFPNKKSGGIGVTTKIFYKYYNDGKIDIEAVNIDGTRYFIVPSRDQKLPDWGFSNKIKS